MRAGEWIVSPVFDFSCGSMDAQPCSDISCYQAMARQGRAELWVMANPGADVSSDEAEEISSEANPHANRRPPPSTESSPPNDGRNTGRCTACGAYSSAPGVEQEGESATRARAEDAATR
jgi:hypothetical protein